MQSLGTYWETQKHALLKPTLTAIPSLLYPQTVLLRWKASAGQTDSGASQTLSAASYSFSSSRRR